MAEKQKNQMVVLEPVTKTVNELLEMITERDQAEIMPFMNPDEAVQCTRQFVPCMFVICIQTNQDIPNVLAVLKKLKPDIKQGLVKTLLVSKVKNPQLQKLIGEFGVTDYIEEPIPARSLQFKANLQLRAVDTTRKQLELKKKAEEKIVFKTSAGNTDDAAQALNGEIKPRNKPALQLANDTFLIKNGQVKKQAKKFLVELDGPDPSTGEWVSDGEDSAAKHPNWRWQPHEQEDEPGAAEGDGWVATGDKPQFKPVNKKWQLSSEKPGLFYKKKNNKIAEKVGVDERGDVTVAEDSPMAEENLRKNLAKVERVRKRKAAEAAGHAPGEKEKQEAKTPPVEEEEAEAKGPEAILKALRKKKAAKPAAAIETEAETEPAEKPEAGATTEDEGSPARKKLEQLRRARKARGAKAEAPEETLAEEAAEEPRAAEPEAEAAAEESESDPIRVQKRKKDKPEKPEAQVLDFLQKKKDGRKNPEADEEEDPAVAEAAAAAEAEPEAESSTEKLLKKARERRDKAKAAGGPEDEIEAAEAEPEAAEAPATEEVAEESVAEAPAEEDSSSTDELLKRARERKKQREARKRELLEEIEAEEAEAEPEEIAAIERAKKKRSASEETGEEEEGSTSERLEKLRRKRAELAALEQAATEEEEQGEHLHTAQAEEPRGLNVWDSDEEAVAADEEAKRLKKLKKDRAEKEPAEKAERGSAEFTDDFAELDGEERKTKKKRKGAAGTQAEGLEEAFAEEAEQEDFSAAAEPTDEENPQESVSDRLARLRKARDGKNAQRNGDDLLGDDPLADKKKSTASSPEAEGEDLFAENKKTRDTGEIEESSAGATSRDGEGNASAEEAHNVNKDEKKAVIESTGDLLAKKSKTSDSMRKFLERRKQKKEIERAEAVAFAGKPKMIEEEAAPGEKRSFLALFVAVSDSFGAASEKKMTGVLRALESSLDHCVAFFAEARSGDERFKVILGNSVEAGAEFPAENSHVEDIAGDAGKVMGHLVIRWSEPRTALAKDEAEAIQRAMLTLSPLASQWIKATRGEKAA